MKNKASFWVKTICTHGIVTALFCLEHYESVEDYETCAVIIKAIEQRNHEILGVNLPTRLDAIAVAEIRETLTDLYGASPDSMMMRYRDYADNIVRTHP